MNEPIMENTKTVSSLEGNLMRESPIQGISVEWESFSLMKVSYTSATLMKVDAVMNAE